MTDIAIQVKDLRKSFKDTEVLKGTDFEVRRGEIFALLGSNGAGREELRRFWAKWEFVASKINRLKEVQL
jgi:ABC-type sugar transport system ATPase subunit